MVGSGCVRTESPSSGDSCSRPVLLVTGIEIAEPPVSSSPRYATALWSSDARRAFASTVPGSHVSAPGAVLSSCTSRTRLPPARPPASARARCAPAATALAVMPGSPCRGRLA